MSRSISRAGQGWREQTVLLIEDDPEEVEIARAALEAGPARIQVLCAPDGAAALELLRSSPVAERPGLILLDLNMPRMNGRETLRHLKLDPELRRIPVVVLTTSTSRDDIRDCYALQASAFVTKPMGLAPFRNAVQAVRDFWMKTAELPSLA